MKRPHLVRALLIAGVVIGSVVWWAVAAAQSDATDISDATDVAATEPMESGGGVPVGAVAEVAEPEAQPEALPVPACVVGDEPAPAAALRHWPYTVLDTRFRLPADYHPDDLVEVVDVLSGMFPGGASGAAQPGQLVRSVMADDLRALFAAAEAEGQALAVQSAFRSYLYQESTFAYWVDLEGYDAALRSSARAGHSEHQLGTTIDFRSRHGPAAWDLPDWAQTSEGAYLATNAWRYGFVMSYPQGSEAESCYSYEPWHYRYVGRELAEQIHTSGQTPRLMLWRLSQEQHEPSPTT